MTWDQPIVKGPALDRILMRIKDIIIIGTAVFAMIRWAYQQKVDISHRLDMFETRLTNMERYMLLPEHKDR